MINSFTFTSSKIDIWEWHPRHTFLDQTIQKYPWTKGLQIGRKKKQQQQQKNVRMILNLEDDR